MYDGGVYGGIGKETGMARCQGIGCAADVSLDVEIAIQTLEINEVGVSIVSFC